MPKAPFLLASLILSLSACQTTKDNDIMDELTNGTPILQQFQTCADTQEYLADVVLNQALSYRYSYYGGWGFAEDAES